MARRMVVDTANLLFRVAAANKHGFKPRNADAIARHGDVAEDGPGSIAGLAMHISLNSLNKYYKQFKPTQIALTFEGGNNWRKDYTRSEECVSKWVYKSNRVKDPSMVPFFELIQAFEALAREHTSLVCLSASRLEGDDLVAGYVQRFSAIGDEVIIISGDKDFVQLLKYPGVRLINPDDGKDRECEDPDFFMFEKCFRGDKGDYVCPALPRVFKKDLEKALKDDFTMTNLLNRTWTFTNPETKEERIYRVGDLFIENNLLMNLECQPDEIRKVIDETLDSEIANSGRFSYFHFMKFLGKYKLKQIADNATSFIDMFSAGKVKQVPEEAKPAPIAKPKETSEGDISTLRF